MSSINSSSEMSEHFASTSAKNFVIVLVTLMTLVILSTIYDAFVRCLMTKRKPNQLFLSFSLLINVRKVLNFDGENETFIGCINGIRSLSIISIILLHSYTFRILLAFKRNEGATIIEDFHAETRMASSISAINISVDSFFVIAGTLITRSMLQHLDRNVFNATRNIIQRFFRITPTLAFVILLNDFLATQIVKNEHDTLLDYSMRPCRQYWWSALLHIQNYVNPHAVCMHTTWQLSVDWQMFLIGPFLIYSLWKYNEKALWFIYALIAASCLHVFTISMENQFIVRDYDLTPNFVSRLYTEYYYPTHTRAAPYLIGIILGYRLHSLRLNAQRMPTLMDKIFTSLSFCVLIAPIFMRESYDIMERDVIKNAIYLSLARVFWASAVAWQIYTCCGDSGRRKKINKFLSNKYWMPISRVGLSIYLVHSVIQYNLIASQRLALSLDASVMLPNFLKDLFLSVFASILLHISIEEPFILIGKYITRNMKKHEMKID